MTKDEIIGQVITLLRDHQQNRRGIIQQEPYKGDFFALFVKAYNAGFLGKRQGRRHDSLDPDALCDILLARDPDVVDSATEYTPWSQFRKLWQEWSYAWDHADQLDYRRA